VDWPTDPAQWQQTSTFNPMVMAVRTARADVDIFQMRWVSEGFRNWLKAGGTVPLERCLRLPSTPGQMARLRRNAWVAKAARVLAAAPVTPHGDQDSPATNNELAHTQTAADLARELDRFVTRGGWSHWRHLPRPPADASKLRICLFHIVSSNNGKSLGSKQVERILKHFLHVDLSWLTADT